jgi:pimeloyl-ACP methyl ester carboxylesterase
MRCEGYPDAEAHQVSQALMKRETARDYHDYREAAERVAANPVASDQAGGEILSEEQFKPANLNSEDFFDPTGILETTTIPVLALFGAKDTLIDPIQGSEAYSRALETAGNSFFQVKVIPDADHILSSATTGCEKELIEKLRTRSVEYAPEFLASIREWLIKLKNRWNS